MGGRKGDIMMERGKEPPSSLNLAPTTFGPRDALGIEDYRKKSCIPIKYMKIIWKHFRWSETKADMANNKTLGFRKTAYLKKKETHLRASPW